jgi:membrane protein YdbS with pleckstrin-like domain
MATGQAGAELDETAEERRNVTRLIRVLAGFVAFPSLTIALAFLVFEGPSAHWMHIAGLSAAFVLAMVAFVMAPRLATRFVP